MDKKSDDGKSPAPIIVIRKVYKAAHGGHGGAWKVAYADFVTSMMAFFLVMWLVGAGSKEQRAAISQYFKNPSMVAGASAVPAPGINGPGGASDSMIKLGGTSTLPHGPGDRMLQRKSTNVKVKTAEKISKAAEKKRLEKLLKQLKQAIDKSPFLERFKKQLLLDITPEGLRIQIVDNKNRPMFALGSSTLMPYTKTILQELAKIINTVPNRISINGHTDETPYVKGAKFSNWELSADRANAARRALLAGSLNPRKIMRVVGYGDTILFDPKNPRDADNRRISIIVLNNRTMQQILERQSGLTVPTTPISQKTSGGAKTANMSSISTPGQPGTLAKRSQGVSPIPVALSTSMSGKSPAPS